MVVACVQTLLTKLKRGEKVESAQPSRFSCSQVPQNQGTELIGGGNFNCFFSFQSGAFDINKYQDQDNRIGLFVLLKN